MPTIRHTEETVYQFDELSDRAKENARDWFRSGDDFNEFYGQSVIDDCARVAKLFGLNMHLKPVKLMNGSTRYDPEVYYSGFYHQGSGCNYAANYSHVKGGLAALRAEVPTGTDKHFDHNNEINRIAAELQAINRRYFYSLFATVRPKHNYFALDVDVSVDRGVLTDEDEQAVKKLFEDVATWIYRSLEAEYEYQNSDEQVDETIRANEYEFDEDGHRI